MTGLPVESASGGRTKFNRTRQNFPKAHWIDAACVGNSGERVLLDPEMVPLQIKSMGHGSRQACRTDRYGFPVRICPRSRTHFGFRTGDLVHASVPSGKHRGIHTGRVAVRANGSFNVRTGSRLIQGISQKHCRLIQRADGYGYSRQTDKESAFLPGLQSGVSIVR